jgi:hypothetical protein
MELASRYFELISAHRGDFASGPRPSSALACAGTLLSAIRPPTKGPAFQRRWVAQMAENYRGRTTAPTGGGQLPPPPTASLSACPNAEWCIAGREPNWSDLSAPSTSKIVRPGPVASPLAAAGRRSRGPAQAGALSLQSYPKSGSMLESVPKHVLTDFTQNDPGTRGSPARSARCQAFNLFAGHPQTGHGAPDQSAGFLCQAN